MTAGKVKTIVSVAVALVLLFIIASTLILPFFSTSYESGFAGDPCNKDNTCAGLTNGSDDLHNAYCITPTDTVVACANCNTTAGYSTFLDTCDRLWMEASGGANGTNCFQCSNFGFKTTSRGLILLVFVMGLIAFALIFVRIVKLR